MPSTASQSAVNLVASKSPLLTFDDGIIQTNGCYLPTLFYWMFNKAEVLFSIQAFKIMSVVLARLQTVQEQDNRRSRIHVAQLTCFYIARGRNISTGRTNLPVHTDVAITAVIGEELCKTNAGQGFVLYSYSKD